METHKLNCWLEIYRKDICDNFTAVKSRLRGDCKICCVVKANAYGHGAVEVAKMLENEDVSYFGVANINEGIKLRENGITKPILIFGYTNPECANLIVEYNLTQAIFSYKYANDLLKYLKPCLKLKCHIKVNSGMNRLGFEPNLESSKFEIQKIFLNDSFDVEGIFTHFYNADSKVSKEIDTYRQFNVFSTFISLLEENNIHFKIKHCCNSAASINFPEMQLDMVRVGASLYGINVTDGITVKEAMSLKAKISQIRTLNKGDKISYGGLFVADKIMKVATITAGYADGIWRSNSKTLKVTINGMHCDVLGTICMDQLMVDVTNVSCKENDEVIIYGKNGVSIAEVAKNNHTIPYEIMCDVGHRAKRIFK